MLFVPETAHAPFQLCSVHAMIEKRPLSTEFCYINNLPCLVPEYEKLSVSQRTRMYIFHCISVSGGVLHFDLHTRLRVREPNLHLAWENC